MSLKRAIRRKNQKKRKKSLIKGLKSALNATVGMPTRCSKCSESFDENSDPASWIVNFSNGNIQLMCPKCVALDT